MYFRPTKGDEDAKWGATNVGQAFPPANSGKNDPVFKGVTMGLLAHQR
jgi:hypothetical protein